jgi:hypothetical protein
LENNTLQKFADDVSILDADNSLVPLADATVTVYDAGTTNLASIFSDNGVTSASNPLTVETMVVLSFMQQTEDMTC